MATLTAAHLTNRQLTQEFEELFRAHSQFVYRTAYAVTGNAEDAESFDFEPRRRSGAAKTRAQAGSRRAPIDVLIIDRIERPTQN